MTPTQEAAMRQALEALEYAQQDRECPSTTRQAITALKSALAEPVQEPVAWEQFHEHMTGPFYRAPPQPPAEPVQDGCAHCNQPLYAAIKCRVCGRNT